MPQEVVLLTKCYREAKRQRDEDIAVMNPFTGATLEKPWY
jgi:hypothetical protein